LVQDGQRPEDSEGGVSAGSSSLAGLIVPYVSFDVLPHLLPVVLTMEKFKSLRSAWVAGNGGIMVLLDQVQTERLVLGDIESIAVLEATVPLLTLR
jgi:hypothetical protein